MRKKVILKNLQWAYPEKDAAWHNEVMKKTYKFYTKEFLDFIAYPKFYDLTKVKFKNEEILINNLTGKGAILVSSHYGSFDKLFYALNGLRIKLTGVAYKQNSGGADLFFKRIREKFMENQLYKGGNPKLLSKALNDNNVLILLSDQDAKKKGVKVKFFNIDSSTHSGAAILGKRKKIPLIYADIIKNNGSYEASFSEIDTNDSIHAIVQQYTSKIEETIRKKPEQYFWFHKRWKSVRTY
jgi:KDO2-lipid IV(A) lauroyltransferase